MLDTVRDKISSFFGWESASKVDSRRKHIRYLGFHAEVVVGDRAYSIRDWSMGGVSFETAPDARLTSGDRVQILLKFRFPHGTITIQQQAQIVRAAKRAIVAKFVSLPAGARQQFERVLDSLHAQHFIESQVA